MAIFRPAASVRSSQPARVAGWPPAPRAGTGRMARTLLQLHWFSILVGLSTIGCHRQPALPLPAEADMAPDRLMIFVHGYVAEADAMSEFIHAFTRDGIPGEWIFAHGARRPVTYHAHSFDFGAFTHAGSDYNIPLPLLADTFSDFYHKLPETCPVCRRRASRPVQVTLVGHSFGGIIVREFLLREAERHGGLGHAPGSLAAEGEGGWHIGRVITTGTPFFGSVRTRLTYGFLSVLVNGLIRTAVMGFVYPPGGSAYGGISDAQARTLSFGSPYLWESHDRWRDLGDRMRQEGRSLPPWLVCLSVGKGLAQVRGDGVTRFASGNIAPLFPHNSMETFISSVPHQQMVRMKDKPWKAREQQVLIHAIARFQEAGTLENDPARLLQPFRIVGAPGEDRFEPDALPAADAAEPPGFRQRVFMQRPNPDDPLDLENFERKTRRLNRVLRADQGDVWFCFHDGLPERTDGTPPRVLPIRTTISLFQDRPLRSRDRAELVARRETNVDGLSVPVVYGLSRPRSHLVAIPDVTPTGVYRMFIRLARGVELTSGDVRVVNEQVPAPPPLAGRGDLVRFRVAPHRTNLVHVYLDRARIFAEHPKLKRLDVRAVALEFEGETR